MPWSLLYQEFPDMPYICLPQAATRRRPKQQRPDCKGNQHRVPCASFCQLLRGPCDSSLQLHFRRGLSVRYLGFTHSPNTECPCAPGTGRWDSAVHTAACSTVWWERKTAPARDVVSRQGCSRGEANKPGDRTCGRSGAWAPAAQGRGEGPREDDVFDQPRMKRRSWPHSCLQEKHGERGNRTCRGPGEVVPGVSETWTGAGMA